MPFDLTETSHAGKAGAAAGDRAVGAWLLGIAAMVLVMVALGGATRLTGSGLSIMEWRPLTGWFPPLSEAEWQRLFDLYRTIPQYAAVNAGMDLAGFREIFWLEYLHRLWGRLIGVAFLAGFAGLWLAGRIRRDLVPRLALLFALGALQGFVGWFMVASGFFPHRTAVSPYRLVIHLGLAFLILAALLWTALGLLRRPAAEWAPAPLRRGVIATGLLAIVAMLAGGFVAGIRAGFDYNTFPLMDGRLVPAGYGALEPWLMNWFENVAAVQFNHRLVATLALGAALWLAAVAWRQRGRSAAPAALLLAGAVVLQYLLGVLTLVHVVPVGLGTLHQTMAALVLAAFVNALDRMRPRAGPGRP
ncbi:heme A synthase [Elioraea sp. Yellowstone]|jgi:cytochrome c oxidase assembly protein subunit 15|uniref:COX15/CtaA family protein n=1 Tax=Elioraea sp. Yellowstone TaxID=2592070 RepID=UPI00114FDD50|nr:COX15/CtaA family protein [Elioraea sp. Yellowstone]TQF77614.1 heme A synthase [Elioraea sp. Yellowstone]